MTPAWHALVTADGDFNPTVYDAARGASGAYAIRRAKGHEVLYVGDSTRGNLWKTLLRHFQAPASFRKVRNRGVFASSPIGYEVALWVTSHGARPRAASKKASKARKGGRRVNTFADQKASEAQATWIATLKPSINLDDGRADPEWAELRAHAAKQEAEAADRPWYENGPRLPPPNVAPNRRAEARTPDLWTGRTRGDEGGRARRDFRAEAARLAADLAECRRAPPLVIVPPSPVAVAPIVRPEGYGEADEKGQARMFTMVRISPWFSRGLRVQRWKLEALPSIDVPGSMVTRIDPPSPPSSKRKSSPNSPRREAARLKAEAAARARGLPVAPPRVPWSDTLEAVAGNSRGEREWEALGTTTAGLMARADREAPTAYRVTISADRTSDGTIWGIGKGKLVAWRDGGRWTNDGLPTIERWQVLRDVERGPSHAYATAPATPEFRRTAGVLVERGELRHLPARGRWPDRWVVTSAGSHALGTFASDDENFRFDARAAGAAERERRAELARIASGSKPAGYGVEEKRGKKAGQLRLLNPGKPRGALQELGVLTCLTSDASFLGRSPAPSRLWSWGLRSAPVLAYDGAGRLFIVYGRRVVAASSKLQRDEYKRIHWGAAGRGELAGGGVAPGPFRDRGPCLAITYTTKKGTDAAPVDYVHAFEGERPRIVEHVCRGGCAATCAARGALALHGGSYRLEKRGIVG